MLRLSVAVLALFAIAPSRLVRPAATVHEPPADSLLGRWDITIATDRGPRPSWLEVELSGRDALVGRFVGIVGSARPISRITMTGDSLRFAIPPQWEDSTGDLVVEGRLQGIKLSGRLTMPNGKSYDWSAVRAPALRREKSPTWGSTINLLDVNSLAGWRPVERDRENQWTVSGGVLRSSRGGVNIMTERTFTDFKLHIEFRYPKNSNSGVYLRGRHEVQIEDAPGLESATHHFGGVYGFLEPAENAAKPAGEWQSYDITLVGRMVTVVANGKTVICNREIPGITGGALDSDEGAPGPLMLQGDHGPIEYRNITLNPAR
jgi:hypothetical protein